MLNYKIFERIYTVKEEKSLITTTKQTRTYKFLGVTVYKKYLDSVIKEPDEDREGSIGFKK